MSEIKKDGHHCEVEEEYMGAVFDCYELEDGTLHVGNGEYGSQVSFCPFCGFEAKVKL